MPRPPRRSTSSLPSRWLLAGGFALLCFGPMAARARDYFVNPSGADGAFSNVQSAVDAVSGQSETDRANIFIAPGKYVQRVIVNKPFVTFIGQGARPEDVILSFNKTAASIPTFSFGESISVSGEAVAFMARNLTFENSTPSSSELQAVALGSFADRAIFQDVRMLGYQDTVLLDGRGRQYIRDSFITGDADFIFGNATAVFDRCNIQSNGHGYVTAASTDRITANGFVFLDCTLSKFGTTPNNSVYLGRPWFYAPAQQMPSVIFIRTRIWPHIKPVGWEPWEALLNPAINRDPYTRLSEFGSMSPLGVPMADANQDGTPDGRVQWADPMTAAQAANYTLQNIFGPVDFWNAATQPEISTTPYESQGDPWNPETQLLSLPAKPGAKPQMLNISTRLVLGAGHPVGIGGFIVTGTQPKQVIIRAIGPSLAAAGLGNALPDPFLEIHGGAADGLIGANDNWQDDPVAAAELSARGIAPAEEAESAAILTLPPGHYTAVLTGKDGAAGTALVEAYDADLVADAQLANISTLGYVGGGADEVLIGGIMVGNGAATIVIRALGPSLASAGVENPISDPILELHTANGSVTSNDDWQTGAHPEIIPVSLQPLEPRESALQAVLAPGHYTAVVRGKGGATGLALVEAYNLE